MADRGFSDLLSSASSLLNSQSHSSNPSQGHASKPSSAEEGTGKPHSSSSSHANKPSYGEVYASAQVVMNAAKSKLHKTDTSSAEDVSYGKLAGAAGTLIGAATHYGKIEGSGIGKYANKAQEYLHSYEIKHSKPGMSVPPSQPSAHHASSDYGHGQPPSAPAPTSSEVNHSQPSAPPQGYPAGYPSQGYPAGYPSQGYPNAQQNYSYEHQGQSKPGESHVNVDNYPPLGYPPAGYPTSGGNYNRPSKYS